MGTMVQKSKSYFSMEDYVSEEQTFDLFDSEARSKVTVKAIKQGNAWKALCPKHNDTNPSLSISPEKRMYHCFGCDFKGSLWDESKKPKESLGDPIAIYNYASANGTVLFESVKYLKRKDKTFRLRRPNGNGGWSWDLNGVPLVLYHLPELLKGSDPVFIVEGEKDVDNLQQLGLTATTNPFGAGKWRPEFNRYFEGRNVVILPDNDDPGKKHAQDVANNLLGIAKTIKIVKLPGLPEKGDVSDFLSSGHSKEELLRLVEESPIFKEKNQVMSTLTVSPSTDEVLLKYHLTDVGNAESFHQLHSRDFIFIKEKKTWVKFDGVRWVEAEGEAKKAMIETMREKAKLAINSFPPQSGEMEKIVKWCLASESCFKLTGAMNIAGSIYASKNHNDFDKDPWLLTCKNGAVDLRNGKLRPSTPEDMFQRSTNQVCDPEAKCPRWIQFLEEIFKGNKELIDFIQRAIGYTLTGLTREQCLFVLYGTGANGKSVFLGVLEEMLGEYGLTTPFSTFKEKNYDGIPNDIARMAGGRFIKSVEIKEGASLNEERIKALTGGDRVTARFLHCEYFEFDPVAKFWIAVNHKPIIRGTDEAIWRRIRLIPFEETFPPERRDKDLLQKLKMELPGILNWAIQGCLRYQNEGLEPVEKVRKATDQYRSESDVINQFLQEKTIEKAGTRAKASDLYNAYKTWCMENGEQALNSTQFGRRLTEKGFEKDKRGSYVYRLGIEIVEGFLEQDS